MEPVAITAAAALYPGARDLNAYWRRVLAAEPAPISSLEARWELPRAGYFSEDPSAVDRTYLDRAFCLDPDALEVPPGQDRQEAMGAAVLARLLAERRAAAGAPAPPPARTALVVATNYVGESYFQADAAAYLRPFLEQAVDVTAPASSAERLLERLVAAAGAEGPRFTVDTACSSSLYALDMGLGLLRTGQADAVAVCGLTGYLPLFLFIGFSRLGAFSQRGEILPFSADASGILVGEGAGAILIERPAPGGPPPLAVVRGLGLSSDGADRSVFAPGKDGQLLAYERAYAGLDPDQVEYVETHGTATPIGDATELETLARFFGERRGAALPIGSVKALVGHQLAGAGMASLLKGLCMLRHGTLAPHVAVTPHPQLAASGCELLAAPRPWSPAGRPRRLGISAFGFGGSNGHLVLEEAPRAEPAARVAVRAPLEGDRLVVTDLEVAIGNAFSTAAWQRALDDDAPATSPYTPERFGLTRDELGGAAPERGVFFPPRFPLETHGLRMGPKLLTRIDPFQLLLTGLTARLLARHPALARSPETGVVVLSNVGGAIALRQYRRFRFTTLTASAQPGGLTSEQAAAARFLGPETTTEAIASSMTTMCSGYPAFHLDLRGLHATFSGTAGALWDALRVAPHWLDTRCQALLLGAGRLLKSPLDLSGGDGAPAEGAGMFLLERASAARARGAEPLAEWVATVPAGAGATFADACRTAGLDPDAVTLRERCQLDPAGELGRAQALAGALGEASGVEALSRVLLVPGELAAIEVVRGGAAVATVFLAKRRTERLAAAALRRPIEVAFCPEPRPGAQAPAATPAPPAEAVPADAFLAYVRETGAAVQAFLRLQREALGLLAPAAGSGDAGAAPAAAGGAAATATAAPAAPPAVGPPVAAVARRLAGLRGERPPALVDLTGEPGRYRARLVVDRTDPYFFDHPLDHVPGVLLLEGVDLLLDAVAGAALDAEPAVRSLRLAFQAFGELAAPVEVELELRQRTGEALRCGGALRQGEQRIATWSAEVGPLPASLPVPPPSPPWPGDPELAHLRKQRAENVLVSRIEAVADGSGGECAVREPAASHLLAAGPGRTRSLTHLLEAVRQATSLASHAVDPRSLDRPRTLVSLRAELERPLVRGEPWAIRIPREQEVVSLGDVVLARLRAELIGSRGRLGAVTLESHNTDPEAYRRLRGQEDEQP